MASATGAGGTRRRAFQVTPAPSRRYPPAPDPLLSLNSAHRPHDEKSFLRDPTVCLTTAPASESSVILLRYIDVVVLVVAAPILLLIGVPASGYLAGAGAWIVLRAVGVAVDHAANAAKAANTQITLRLSFLLSRLFLLAITVILVRKNDGRDAGLTALALIVFAFTAELVISAATRPRRR
ncbi:MAG: hypothetical protein ACR2JH_08035 [Solirubrobacteraceae bacterium]